MIDVNKAKFDPSSIFLNPEEVLTEESLSREEKILILRQWEYDARQLAVAEEENMGGGSPNMLAEILETLNKLEAEKTGQAAPNRSGSA